MSARVLVVDDIEANRRLLQAKLEAQYYTVIHAENGQQALDIARVEVPEIILLDVMMPGMDGHVLHPDRDGHGAQRFRRPGPGP